MRVVPIGYSYDLLNHHRVFYAGNVYVVTEVKLCRLERSVEAGTHDYELVMLSVCIRTLTAVTEGTPSHDLTDEPIRIPPPESTELECDYVFLFGYVCEEPT